MENCPFCQIVKNPDLAYVLLETEYAIAFLSNDPVTDGHMVVAAKEHFRNVTESTLFSLFVHDLALEIARALAQPCQLLTNVGAAAGQTVEHLHYLIVPRSDDDGVPRPPKKFGGPQNVPPTYLAEQASALAPRLRGITGWVPPKLSVPLEP